MDSTRQDSLRVDAEPNGVEPVKRNVRQDEYALLGRWMQLAAEGRTPEPPPSDVLTPEAITDGTARKVLTVMTRLHSEGVPPDLVQVTDGLKAMGVANPATVATHVLNAGRNLAETNMHRVTLWLAQEYIRRQSADVLVKAAQEAMQPGVDPWSLAQDVAQQLQSTTNGGAGRAVPLGTAAKEAAQQARTLSSGDRAPGVPTGISALDHITGNAHPGELVLIAGDSGGGKTVLGVQAALGAAVHTGTPALYWSCEMGATQLAGRVMAAHSDYDARAARRGTLSDYDLDRLDDAAHNLADVPLYVMDDPGAYLEDVFAEAERMHRTVGCSAIVVDYVQMADMRLPADSYERHLSAMGRACKVVAGRLGCPVYLLSQLTLPDSGDRRPELRNVRGSRSLVNHSDQVWLIYRPEVYGIDYCAYADCPTEGLAEVIVAKHRHDKPDSAYCTFLGQQFRFVSGKPSLR